MWDKPRRWLGAATLCAMLFAGLAGTALAQEDTTTTEPTEADTPAPPTAADTPAPPTEADTPAPLEPLSGTLSQVERDYAVDGTPVSFGPFWFLGDAAAPADFDGDGVVGSMAEELAGLIGNVVDLQVEVDADGEADVFGINGSTYREQGVPPAWAGKPSWVPGPPPFAGTDG